MKDMNRITLYGNIRNGAFLVLFFCIGVFPGMGSTVLAHNGAAHTSLPENSVGLVQQFAVETLRIPNVPVIDASYHTEGFIARFVDAGTIVISLTYTDCKTLCPISNVILQQLDKALSDSNSPSLQIVTLSIDPERETPDTLQASSDFLDSSKRWTWLTATSEHSRMLFKSLDVDINALEDHDPMFLVGNVSTGRFIRVVGMPDPDQLIAIGLSEQL